MITQPARDGPYSVSTSRVEMWISFPCVARRGNGQHVRQLPRTARNLIGPSSSYR